MTTKILVLASNPQGTEQLRLNPEIREIEDALERGKNREQIVLRWRSAVRVKDLQHWIRNSEARIVHFCGHGVGIQGLVLETNSGRQQLLDTQALADLFKLFKNQVECVVLNACYSEVQAAEINQHINYVIGTKKEIRDDAAIFFSTGFYEALGDGETIERAYEFGRNRIQLEIYGSSNRERKLVPVYSEAESTWVELPQNEVIKLLITESLNSIVEYSPSLTADKEAIIQLPFIARSPYKGLKRFNARDKDLFFGRERLTNKLIEAVNQSNLVLVLGASGSGKSSVVRAGLIPQIESLSETPYQCCLFTPNRDPFICFHRRLLDPEEDIFSESEVDFVLEGKSDTLSKTADLLKTKNPQWLIFIDQFEELFTICSKLETRRNFIQGIIHIAQDTNKSVKLILAMRSDFLEELSAYSQFAKIVEKNIYLVADMQTEELRQAIEQPAAQHGIVFESGLVNEIIHDVQGQAGSLPLLQYTLDLLWQEDDLSDRNRTLNIATYRQLGGVSGALQKHVNQIYQRLPPEEQLATKQILLRLVDVVGLEKSEVLKTAVSRRAYKSEFPEAQADTVNLLVNKTLLVSDDLKQEGQSTVEIAHEALLTSWAELKNWITDARDTISLNNRLAEDANRWQGLRSENQEQANEELWSGSKLEKVIELRKDGTFDVVLGGLSDIANEFIDASIDWRDRRIKEKLAAARKLLFGAVISIFLLSGLSIAAVSFAVKSNKQEKMQFARQLAITSKWIRNQRAKLHEPSVLLALESYKLSHDINEPSSEADSALRDGLNLLPNNIAAISHQDFVSQIEFSPNGDYLATASRDGEVKLVQVNTGTEITTISHQGFFPLIGFSRNGDYLATASSDGELKLVQVNTGTEITIISHQGSFPLIKFSRNWDYLVTRSDDGTVKLIQVSTGKEITTISHQDFVWDIKFSPNGDYLATRSDGTAKLVQVSTGTEITTIFHQDRIFNIKFSPNGDYLATASDDGTAKLVQVSTSKEITTISHQDRFYVKFSPNGDYLATASDDGTAKLIQVSTGTEITTISHQDRVHNIKFSPNGDYLATASSDGTAKLVQVSTGTEITTISHQDRVHNIKFSPNGDYLTTASSDGTAKLVQVSTGREIATISHQGSIQAIKFSPKGEYLAIASEDYQFISRGSFRTSNHTAQLIQVSTGTEIAILSYQGSVKEIEFSPNGDYLAAGSRDGRVKLVQISTGTEIVEFSNQGSIRDIQFSPKGDYLATGSFDGTAKLIQVSTGTEIATISHQGSVNRIRFSPNGDYLATATHDGEVKLVQVSSLKVNPLIWDKNRFTDIQFSPDGDYLATGSRDGEVKLVEVSTAKEMTSISHQGSVNQIRFSPKGDYLATGSRDGEVKLVQVSRLKVKALIFHKTRVPQINFIEFSPNGDYLVTKSSDNTVKLVQVSTGKEIATIPHSEDVWQIEFSPQGDYLATRTGSVSVATVIHTAKLVQVKTGQITIFSHEGTVNRIKFSPNGDYLATVSDRGTAKLVQISTGKERTFPLLEDKVWEIEFSPDGNYLVVGSFNGTVKSVQVSTGKEMTLLSHAKIVREIEFSPNGDYLATGSDDGTVKLVQVSTGKEIATISHQDDINEIEFNPNGDYLATRSDDGMVKLVQVSTGNEIATVSHQDDINEIEFSPNGDYLTTASKDGTVKLVQVKTGQITVFSHEASVWEIEFSPKGDYLATRSEDGTAKLVQVSTGKEIAVISHEASVWEIEFSPKGDYFATRSSNNVRLDLLQYCSFKQKI